MRLLALHENCDGEENNYPLRIASEKLVNAPYSAIFTIESNSVVVFAVPDQRLHLTSVLTTRNLDKAFLNASVRFTHFIRTTDDVDVNFAWAALCRGTAIICRDVQEAVDLVIPVVFNRDNRIVKENITGTFIRCKLRP